jgi:RNA polymerase sigma-70 factor (sigma-E family)
VKAPDEAEFRAYAAARMRPLRRTAYLLCGDWHHAEDAVQVVLAKLYTHWDRVDRRDALDGYVRTMLIRATLEHRRRLWWRRELTTSAVPDVAATPPVDPEERIVLVQALAKLPPRQRAVVVLRFWEDLDVAQTAAALGCSEGTVKSQTSHGLTALRSLLTETHPAEGKTS